MLLRYFYDDKLAQASYLVGCARTGEALVVDPMRDITPYLDTAAREGLRITHVAETHIHADYVSGGRELAAATGATLYVSDCGTPDWKYAFANQPRVMAVCDGDMWMVGNIKVEVMHTPGHTPEHIAFVITDTAGADKPIGIFTGDAIFVGDVGRPDLLEEAAGIAGTKEPGARQQYHTVERFKALPDYLQLWPAHGAGSACGKALGAIPSTTLGYEKLFNPAFQFHTEGEFVQWLLDGQPEPPRYFARMKHINKVGAPLIAELPVPPRLTRSEAERALASGATGLDLRPRPQFAQAHLAGMVSAPPSSKMSTFIGSLVDVSADTVLMLDDVSQLAEALNTLRAVGFDRIIGCCTPDILREGDDSLPVLDSVEALAAHQNDHALILDVRGHSEWQERHIDGAVNIALAHLPARLADLPTDRPIIVQCASGYRSQMTASWLRAQGYHNVVSLGDGEARWSQVFPTVAGALQPA
jgi:hydroxyacylglutathione hydrolase